MICLAAPSSNITKLGLSLCDNDFKTTPYWLRGAGYLELKLCLVSKRRFPVVVLHIAMTVEKCGPLPTPPTHTHSQLLHPASAFFLQSPWPWFKCLAAWTVTATGAFVTGCIDKSWGKWEEILLSLWYNRKT